MYYVCYKMSLSGVGTGFWVAGTCKGDGSCFGKMPLLVFSWRQPCLARVGSWHCAVLLVLTALGRWHLRVIDGGGRASWLWQARAPRARSGKDRPLWSSSGHVPHTEYSLCLDHGVPYPGLVRRWDSSSIDPLLTKFDSTRLVCVCQICVLYHAHNEPLIRLSCVMWVLFLRKSAWNINIYVYICVYVLTYNIVMFFFSKSKTLFYQWKWGREVILENSFKSLWKGTSGCERQWQGVFHWVRLLCGIVLEINRMYCWKWYRIYHTDKSELRSSLWYRPCKHIVFISVCAIFLWWNADFIAIHGLIFAIDWVPSRHMTKL